MQEEKEESKKVNAVLQLVDIKRSDVTLKFIFDNIRNYGIAAAVMILGYYLLQNGAQISPFPCFGVIFGVLLIIVGFIMCILNFVQFVLALISLELRFIPYFILSMLVFIGATLVLTVTFIKQAL